MRIMYVTENNYGLTHQPDITHILSVAKGWFCISAQQLGLCA